MMQYIIYQVTGERMQIKKEEIAMQPEQRFDYSVLASISIVTRETLAEEGGENVLFILTLPFLQIAQLNSFYHVSIYVFKRCEAVGQ